MGNSSVPDKVKEESSTVFNEQNRDAIIAELMREAMGRAKPGECSGKVADVWAGFR